MSLSEIYQPSEEFLSISNWVNGNINVEISSILLANMAILPSFLLRVNTIY